MEGQKDRMLDKMPQYVPERSERCQIEYDRMLERNGKMLLNLCAMQNIIPADVCQSIVSRCRRKAMLLV